MGIIAEGMPDCAALPRRADGLIDVQGLLRLLAERVVNAVMDAEADQFCAETGVARSGYRERTLKTCLGDLTLRVPKVRLGSFFPQTVTERCQRVDRALAAAVAEMYAGGTSTRKVQRVAEAMGVSSLGKDQVSAICACLDADVDELVGRPLSGAAVPYAWLDATYVKCRREGRVASTAVVTAIGCDEGGWRRVLGVSVVDTESYAQAYRHTTALRNQLHSTDRTAGELPRRCARHRGAPISRHARILPAFRAYRTPPCRHSGTTPATKMPARPRHTGHPRQDTAPSHRTSQLFPIKPSRNVGSSAHPCSRLFG